MSGFTDKLISKEKALELQNNWIKNQGSLIDQARKERDVRDFLFDLEELQVYIDMVLEESKAQGIFRPWIWILFGSYGEDQAKQATIFLQATKDVKGVQQTESDQESEQVPNNYGILGLNTVLGGFPPTDL